MSKKNIIKLIAGVTISMAAANKIVSILSNLNNSFSKDDYLNYESKFGNIKYRKSGTGTPLLLIHNLSVGDNIMEWDYIIEHLSEQHTVYSLNLAGCGNSDKNNIIYTNFMYVKLIIDFVNDIIKSKTDIVTSGNSNQIAVMAELYNSNVFNKIIMINPSTSSTVKHHNLIGHIINLPIIGTFIYNCIFNKKYCLKNTKGNYRLYNYMNSCYDSIHYKNSNSKFLYTSIKKGNTCINYRHAIRRIRKQTFTYIDNDHKYPLIETPQKVAKYILSNIK